MPENQSSPIFNKLTSLAVNVVGAPMALTAQVGMFGWLRTGLTGGVALFETGIAFGIEKGINACVFSNASDDSCCSWINKPWVGKAYASFRNGVVTFTIANMVTGLNIAGDLPNRPLQSDNAFLVEGVLIGTAATAAVLFAPEIGKALKNVAKHMTLGFISKPVDEEKQSLMKNKEEEVEMSEKSNVMDLT